MSGEVSSGAFDYGSLVRGLRLPMGRSLANLRNRGPSKDKQGKAPDLTHNSLNRRKSLSVSDISSFSVGRTARQLVPENDLARQSRSDQSSQSSLLRSRSGREGRSVGGSIGDLMNSGEFRPQGGNWSPRTCSPITLSMVNVSEGKSTESLHPCPASPCPTAMTSQRQHHAHASRHHYTRHQDSSRSPTLTLSLDEPEGTPAAAGEAAVVSSLAETMQLGEMKGRGGIRTCPSSPQSCRGVRSGRGRGAEDATPTRSRRSPTAGANMKPRFLEHKVTIAVEPPYHHYIRDHPGAPRDASRVNDPQYDPGPGELASVRAKHQLGCYPGECEGFPREFSNNMRDSSPIMRHSRFEGQRDSKKMSMAERTQMLAHLIHDQHQRCSKDTPLFVVRSLSVHLLYCCHMLHVVPSRTPHHRWMGGVLLGLFSP